MRAFGKAASADAMFLLGSISKPICVTALMTLFDRGEFKLDDPLKKFIPQFAGDRRDQVTMQHLLTHVSRAAGPIGGKQRVAKQARVAFGVCCTRNPHAAALRPGFKIPVFEHGDPASRASGGTHQRN